ncbi:hypothetical protein AB1Y20_022642 [Prymnesium parvum]|uniref:Uncharacterized protein n=1 Tax=Prymnesium parvum TaxID=97485 RepID=A0AB34JHR9_PRYPA
MLALLRRRVPALQASCTLLRIRGQLHWMSSESEARAQDKRAAPSGRKRRLYPTLKRSVITHDPNQVPEPTKEDWLTSEARTAALSHNEKWLAAIAVGSSAAAIAMFTWVQIEVSEKVENLPENVREDWKSGVYVPGSYRLTDQQSNNDK